LTGTEQADRSQGAKEREDLSGLTDDQKKARRNKKAREARAAKKMKDQGLEVVEEEILTQSYIGRVEAITSIASTAPARIESSSASRKRSVSKVSISSDSFEDAALFYPSDDSTGEPGPAPKSPPRSGQQPFVMSQPSVEEDEFPMGEDEEALLAVAEAQVTLAREQAEANAEAVDNGKGKGKGRKVDTVTQAVEADEADGLAIELELAIERAVDLEIELQETVSFRPRRQRKGVRLFGDSQTWDRYVQKGDI